MVRLSAGAVLPLTGRYAALAAGSADGLRAWAAQDGADLTIVDCGDDPDKAARAAVSLADAFDIFFGPYGSGPMRAVADALEGRHVVVWNHGGAAVPHRGAWMVDILGAADTYWAGLGDVLATTGAIDRVAVLHAASAFGRAVAAGAVGSLARRGVVPMLVAPFDRDSAARSVVDAIARGATAVIGCGRYEDDIALGRALAGAPVAVGLVACGVHAAVSDLGQAIVGWFGPSQWVAGSDLPPGLGADADYPAAQAYATGLIAREAVAAAGSTDPPAVWDAARRLRTRTFFGPFAVDRDGRQVAHRPLVVRWAAGADGPVREVIWRPGGGT